MALQMPMQQLSFEIERLQSGQDTLFRATGSVTTIKMIIGDWYVDELGMPTRQITARQSKYHL